jgi:GT2 family glycosyltransferase
MRCGIIIVNYNTADQVADCLRSLSTAITPGHDQVIIVDNNSQDGSCDKLAMIIEGCNWGWVTLLPLSTNDGFAAGNNAGILFFKQKKIQFDCFLLLNPDTIVHKDAIYHLIEFLKNHPAAGIVGAQLYNAEGQPESSSRRFPSVFSELDAGARFGIVTTLLRRWKVALPVSDHAHLCDWVSGAAMMVRWEVIEQVGLMDDGFFLYFEEVDYCHRTKDKGWQVWLEPRSHVIHLEGAATGIRTARKRRGQYWYDSRRRYFIKHLGVIQWLLADLLWAMGRMILLARKALGFGGDTSGDPQCFMQDLLWGDLKALVSGQFNLNRHTAFYQE